jgi:hypothetical protein
MHPEWFQGDLRKRFYFEGWYNKLVDANAENIYAFIPGIALNKKSGTSHAFIQALDGKTAEYTYIKYPLSEFHADTKSYHVSIGSNYFTPEKIHLDIEKPIYIQGDLDFTELNRLRRKLTNPGVMGPFSWLPFMETKHGVVSMNHKISGSLKIKNKTVDFTHGKGYIEKDWGISFPSNWIWMQTNHFDEDNRSFMFSLARINYLGIKFTGFLGVLLDRDEIMRFGTYTRAKIHNLQINPIELSFDIHMKKHILKINAKKSVDATGSSATAQMLAPDKGEMSAKCLESISSQIRLELYEKSKSGNRLLFEDSGKHAGLEIMGTKNDFFH